MQTTRLILVGGFLGAGKTTLMAQALQRLVRQGKRVGLITNDQAANLVDTEILKALGAPVEEVAGGCFCCRFDDLVSAMDRLLAEHHPDVLIGEPVGSCTDLAATVIQPARKLLGDRFRVAPFSVLVDPSRVLESLPAHARARFPQNVVYIFRKQLEEADVIVLNKADLLPAGELARLSALLAQQFPQKPVITMSALSGEGVDAWLDAIAREQAAGAHVTDVDYDVYAEGEAALGWLNAAVHLRAEGEVDWRRFCLELVDRMQHALRAESAEIAHLKLRLTAGAGNIVVNLTSTAGTPSLRGTIQGAPPEALLLLNARAHTPPDRLKSIVEQCLPAAAGPHVKLSIDDLRSFAPGRPQPTHRFTA